MKVKCSIVNTAYVVLKFTCILKKIFLCILEQNVEYLMLIFKENILSVLIFEVWIDF
jgi:hypothetical protein